MKLNSDWLLSLAIGSCVAAVCMAIYGYGADKFEQGKHTERAAWQQREAAELTAANARIIQLTADARQAEQQHAADMAQASATYQEHLQHEKATRDRTVADLRSGALRLRVELARREAAGGSAAAEGSSGTGRCDAEAYGELSPAASEFLVGLASEADDVVHQLTAAQDVITACEKLTQGARK